MCLALAGICFNLLICLWSQEQAIAASASALLHLAMFLWHTGSQERARSCAEHALDTAPGDPACASLLGWILVHSTSGDLDERDAEDVEHASSLFEQALQKKPKHIEVELSCFKLSSIANMLHH